MRVSIMRYASLLKLTLIKEKKNLFRPATSSCAGPWIINTAMFKDKVY